MTLTGFITAAVALPRHGSSSPWICGAESRYGGACAAAPRRHTRVYMDATTDAEKAAKAIKPEAEGRMQKTLDSTNATFNTVRTGRANASILDRITVDYYGASTPLNQLATVSVSGSSTLVVDPYDKTVIKDIERALMESDVGITPSNDGSCIRLAVPPLTKDRRTELAKQVKSMAEEGRVALRNIRRDAVEKAKKMEKAKDIGQDDSKGIQADIQKATDKFTKELDGMLKRKEEDIMKV